MLISPQPVVPKRIPYLLIGLGIILSLSLLILAFESVFDKAEPEMLYIPKDFRGKIIIVFNHPEGAAKEVKNGKRIYRIPPSGILVTQFSWNRGWINREYKYVEDNTNIDEVESNYQYNNGDTDGDKVSLIHTGPYTVPEEKPYFLKPMDSLLMKEKRLVITT